MSSTAPEKHMYSKQRKLFEAMYNNDSKLLIAFVIESHPACYWDIIHKIS